MVNQMKNLKTILTTNVECTKYEQKSQRAMKSELENKLREMFASLGLEVYEAPKGFNVELFDGENEPFAININPVVKSYDFDIHAEHEIELELRAEKEKEAKAKAEAKAKKIAEAKAKRVAKK